MNSPKTVLFPAYLQRHFAKLARKLFPKEAYCILLGRKLENSPYLFHIEDLYIPADLEKHVSPDFVNVQKSWFGMAHEVAFQYGKLVLGDLHSHCYDESSGFSDAAPSEADLDRIPGVSSELAHYYSILGIYHLARKKQKKFRGRFKLYPACPPFRIKT